MKRQCCVCERYFNILHERHFLVHNRNKPLVYFCCCESCWGRDVQILEIRIDKEELQTDINQMD